MLKEMGSRYLFIILYVWLEEYFSRGDYQRSPLGAVAVTGFQNQPHNEKTIRNCVDRDRSRTLELGLLYAAKLTICKHHKNLLTLFDDGNR
jgi:hypothetical protein